MRTVPSEECTATYVCPCAARAASTQRVTTFRPPTAGVILGTPIHPSLSGQLHVPPAQPARVGLRLGDVEVQLRCGETLGHWHCVSHNLGFRAALLKKQHVEDDAPGQDHLLVWVCRLHGPEAPQRWDKP